MERYYPFEHKKENIENRETQEKAPAGSSVQGKGRRDGNSPVSLVIHSGKVTERAKQIRERKEREAGAPNASRFEQRSDRKKDFSGKKTASARFDAENDLRGKKLELTVQENTEYGAFLLAPGNVRILLPFAEQTERPSVGDKVRVTVYEDKGGRLTATMREPLIGCGETGVLTIAAVTKIGAFADNGMPKQVLIPFREMLHTPEAGDRVLVYLYKDKSGREAGTMRVYRHLKKESGYHENDRVEGFVYEINPDLGAFVAVDNCFYGMIPKSELYQELHYGDVIQTRVAKVREDGKLDLMLRDKLYQAADRDAARILAALKENGGSFPFADRADAGLIREKFSMSKNQFKQALGWLYRRRLVEIDRENDRLTLSEGPAAEKP